MVKAQRSAKSRVKAKAKSMAKTKTNEKPKKSVNPGAARKVVLGCISKPYKNAGKEQKRFFKNFLARLEERDKKLEQSDLKAASEDAMNYVSDEVEGEMRLEWEVEEILDAATIDGELHYMVLWKGHLIEECTWETEANLANSRDAIDDFHVAFPKKRRGPSVAKKGKMSATKSDI